MVTFADKLVYAGKPIATAEELEPLMPDRAGVAMTLSQKLQIMFKMVTRIFSVYANRPSVSVIRATAVSYLALCNEKC